MQRVGKAALEAARRIGPPSRAYVVFALGLLPLPFLLVWLRGSLSANAVLACGIAYLIALRLLAEVVDR